MDVSARATMKDAANCDKRCEWQNSANQENAERILRSQVIPESMSSSGRSYTYDKYCIYAVLSTFMCASDDIYLYRYMFRWRMKIDSPTDWRAAGILGYPI